MTLCPLPPRALDYVLLASPPCSVCTRVPLILLAMRALTAIDFAPSPLLLAQGTAKFSTLAVCFIRGRICPLLLTQGSVSILPRTRALRSLAQFTTTVPSFRALVSAQTGLTKPALVTTLPSIPPVRVRTV